MLSGGFEVSDRLSYDAAMDQLTERDQVVAASASPAAFASPPARDRVRHQRGVGQRRHDALPGASGAGGRPRGRRSAHERCRRKSGACDRSGGMILSLPASRGGGASSCSCGGCRLRQEVMPPVRCAAASPSANVYSIPAAPAWCTILPHCSISRSTKRASSAGGVEFTRKKAHIHQFLLALGGRDVAREFAVKLVTTRRGVPAGAVSICQGAES